MKVSGSILSVKDNYLDYACQLKQANVDYLHVDIFQDDDNFTIGDLLQFNDTYLPLDVHLIFSTITDDDIEILNKVNTKYLNVQYENLDDKSQCYNINKKFHGKFGIAITADTSISVIDQYLNELSQVLIMCSTPGVTGAKFNDDNYERVRLIHEKYPSLKIIVDGGINAEIGKKMGRLGASIIVSGSYLCKDMVHLSRNGYYLKYMNERNINVKRNMISLSELPIVDEMTSFMEIINMMNKYRLGVVFVVCGSRLLGIISDGDVRRGFIKFQEEIFHKKAFDLMNVNPFTINSDKCMEDVYDALAELRRGIDIVPVVENNRLKGALDLHIGK